MDKTVTGKDKRVTGRRIRARMRIRRSRTWRMPSKTLRSAWSLRALIWLKSWRSTKVVNSMV
eukprot:1058933-Rhodomonas_salina.1